jgi:predicted Zn-ribbon and HTH transcriptional regulator
MLLGAMVESNHDEERFARIEHMVETLRREGAAFKIVPAKFVTVVGVVAHAPEVRRLKPDA